MRGETFRYTAVVVLGYGVDFLVAFLALGWLSFPLPVAATTGFLCAFVLNYILHEFWTFRREESGFSVPRLFQALGAALCALAVRVGFLVVVGPYAASDSMRYAMLVAAAGLSFLVNYLLLRAIFFFASSASKCAQQFA
jgi:putative flippase GtrA